MGKYITLENLEAYKLSRKLSKLSWEVYEKFEWRIKKIIGDQFIGSTDSGGANIAEGYGRFHFLDKMKFYYNARGSLFESKHRLDLLFERNLVDKEFVKSYLKIYKRSLKPQVLAKLTTFGYEELNIVLNGLIKSLIKAKNNP